MELLKVLLCIVVTIAIVHKCDASECCFPPAYQGFQEIIKATLKDGRMSVLTGTIQYWHDNISRRSAFVEKLVIDGKPTELKIINDYNVTNTKYTIIGTRCTQKSLVGDYPLGCISDNAKNEQRRYLGKVGSQNGMNIRTFDMNLYPSDVSRLTVDADNCFLLSTTTVVPGATQPYMQHVLFSNFTEGITDNSVFDVPTVCQNPIVGK